MLKAKKNYKDDNIAISIISKLIIKILGALPLFIRSALGRFLGRVVALFSFRDKKIADLQLRYFLSDSTPQKTISDLFAHFGEMFFQFFNFLPMLNKSEQLIECDTIPRIKEILKTRPIVALTSHLGNWELLAAYIVKEGVPITTIAKQAKNKLGQALIKNLREKYQVQSIWKQDRAGLKEMVKNLRPGNVIASLIDQDTNVRSINVPFLNYPAKTSVGLIEIGKKYNAKFITAFIVKDSSTKKYHIYVEEVPDELTVEDVLTLYNQRLGELVIKYPSQWPWIHKRWRSGLIPNTQLSSTDYIKELKGRLNEK